MDVFKREGYKRWYGRYRDLRGVFRQVALFPDKRSSVQAITAFGNALDRLRAGGTVARSDVPPALLDRFGIELIRANHPLTHMWHPTREPLVCDLVQEWVKHQRYAGRTEQHILFQKRSVESLLATLKRPVMSEVIPFVVREWLNGLLEQGVSAGSHNQRLTAIKGFFNWCEKMGKLDPNLPMINLKSIPKKNVHVDRRRTRRALSVKEEKALLFDCDPDSYPLYLFMLRTGLRRAEVKRLLWQDIDFERKEIVVPASSSKARRDETVPMCQEVVKLLGEEFKEPLGSPVFKIPAHASARLRQDLRACGVREYDEHNRVIDFHSFRYTFGMRLAAAGVSMQDHVRLMRHSDPKLSLICYRDVKLMDEAGVIDEVFPCVDDETGK